MASVQSAPMLPTASSTGTPAVGTTFASRDSRKVAEMAKDFEAMFLSLILKEMRQSLEPHGMFAGDSGDVQGGLFDMYLGKHLADSGGVGLAATIQRHLASPAATSGNQSNNGLSSTQTAGPISGGVPGASGTRRDVPSRNAIAPARVE